MDSYLQEIEAARAARVKRLLSDRGWLALVGKTFLSQGTLRVGSAVASDVRLPDDAPEDVGTLVVEGHRVRFDAAEGVSVTCNGELVASRVLVSDLAGPADRLLVGGYGLELMERGDALALRVRDIRGARGPFAGISHFDVDPAWRKTGRFIAHASPVPIEMEFEGGSDGSVSQGYMSRGVVVFDVGGQEQRLDVFDEDGARLYILFRDATSGKESYALGRFIYAPLPDADGNVVLDFNRAMVPGCAFSVYATCPIPPVQNRLKVAVPAGEKEYLGTAIGA